MNEYRQYQHLTADPTMAVAYGRIADLQDTAARRRRRTDSDPRIVPTRVGRPTLLGRRLRSWWHRGPQRPIAPVPGDHSAKRAGATKHSDLASTVRC